MATNKQIGKRAQRARSTERRRNSRRKGGQEGGDNGGEHEEKGEHRRTRVHGGSHVGGRGEGFPCTWKRREASRRGKNGRQVDEGRMAG